MYTYNIYIFVRDNRLIFHVDTKKPIEKLRIFNIEIDKFILIVYSDCIVL